MVLFNSQKKKLYVLQPFRNGQGIPSQILKKGSASLLELSALAEELAEECSYPPAGFLKPQIRQHILDILK